MWLPCRPAASYSLGFLGKYVKMETIIIQATILMIITSQITTTTTIGMEHNLTIKRLSSGMSQSSLSDLQAMRLPEDDKILLSEKAMRELCHYLVDESPPHIFYLLYDYQYKETDIALAVYYKSDVPSLVLKFTPGLVSVRNALGSRLRVSSTQRRHVLLLCSMDNVALVFDMVSSENLESPWIWWLVVVTEEKAMKILEQLLRDGSQVILMKTISANSVRFFVSRVESDGNIRFSDRGTFKETESGFKSYLTGDLFVDLDNLYSDFGGRQLTATANHYKPWISFSEQNKGELVLEHGIDASIIKAMAKGLNFTVRMVTTIDKAWGAILENGTVVGMVGMVHRREAHFASCELTITSTRETVVDFTSPYYIESFTLISQAPKRLQRVLAVFSSFTSEVWYCIVGSIFLTGIFIFVLSRIITNSWEDSEENHTFSYVLLNLFGSLMLQHNLTFSRYWPVKFTFLFWYFYALIVSDLYSGMMIATLVIPSYEKPINSLYDLPAAVANGYTFVIIANSLQETILKEAKDGVYAQSWKLLNHKDRSKTFLEDPNARFDEILTNKLILTKGETAARYTAMESGIEQYYFARETFAAQYYGIACNLGSPFQFKFSKMLSYMVEGGLIRKWRDDEFLRVAGKAKITQENITKPFNLSQLQAAFYVLILGFLSAVLSFIFENLYVKVSSLK